jgi:hypothetical protein
MRLDRVVPMAVLSGNYAAAIAEYERTLGPPKTKARARSVTPRRYAYEVARCLSGTGDVADLKPLGDALLSTRIESYLVYGQFIEAASIVCLVRSKVEGATDPIAAMRAVVRGPASGP